IGERPFREFLERYLPRKPGEMVTLEGKHVGRHQGLMYYTIGQRQGLGIGGTRDGAGEPWFVADKRMDRNELVVVQGHEHPALLRHALRAQDASWISGEMPTTEMLAAKTRYRQADAHCRLLPRETSSTAEFSLSFEHPQWAVTPGQSAVVYDGDICLGGGVISQ
ncbi:MAG: tRNA methyl transferase PRC-barrel domain-containing protein, partial [Betaproteobacteria bacterium]